MTKVALVTRLGPRHELPSQLLASEEMQMPFGLIDDRCRDPQIRDDDVADSIRGGRKDVGDLRGPECHSEIGLEMGTRYLGPAATQATGKVDRQSWYGQ